MNDRRLWVYRRDITIERESEYVWESESGMIKTWEAWTATFHGRISTDEKLSLSDVGATYAEALGNLEQTLEGMGLEIRA